MQLERRAGAASEWARRSAWTCSTAVREIVLRQPGGHALASAAPRVGSLCPPRRRAARLRTGIGTTTPGDGQASRAAASSASARRRASASRAMLAAKTSSSLRPASRARTVGTARRPPARAGGPGGAARRPRPRRRSPAPERGGAASAREIPELARAAPSLQAGSTAAHLAPHARSRDAAELGRRCGAECPPHLWSAVAARNHAGTQGLRAQVRGRGSTARSCARRHPPAWPVDCDGSHRSWTTLEHLQHHGPAGCSSRGTSRCGADAPPRCSGARCSR